MTELMKRYEADFEKGLTHECYQSWLETEISDNKRYIATLESKIGMYKYETKQLKAQLTWRPVSEKPEKDEMCTWQEDEDGLWHTDCHEIHQFFDGTPTENSYKFCPYCAKPLKEEKYNDQKE